MSEWSAKLLGQLSEPAMDWEVLLTDALWDRGCFEELLIEAVGSRGVWINFSTALAESEQGILGGFTVRGGVPSISLYREQATRLAGDPLTELITLAHELGHAQSWRLGYRTPAYQEVVDRVLQPAAPFTSDEAGLVLDEELRAWRYGRATLRGMGFKKWAALEQQKADALAVYCERMRQPTDSWKEREKGCENSAKGETPTAPCASCDGLGWVMHE